MQTLYLLMGIQGAGKTTYAKKMIDNNTVHISRDEIRFKLIEPNEEYFAKEAQVFKTFMNEINNNLKEGKNVVADATHLNEKSRSKFFHYLKCDKSKLNIVIIFIDTPLEKCLEQNELRKGSRAYVPRNVIKKAYNELTIPTREEQNKYNLNSMITVWKN